MFCFGDLKGKVEEQPDPWDGLFLEVDLPTEFSRSMDSNQPRRNSHAKKGKGWPKAEPTVQEEEEASVLLLDEESPTMPSEAASPSSKKKLDEKTLAKIFQSVSKYEQQTWERLHVEQEAVRKKLFAQWAQKPTEMTSKEYHKMLTKMHKLARSSMPGDLKPGDTLATMQYMLEVTEGKEGESKKPQTLEKRQGHSNREEGFLMCDRIGSDWLLRMMDFISTLSWGPCLDTDFRQSSRMDKEDNLLLPFAAWHRCMSGKLRPEALAKEVNAKEAKPN